MSWASPETKTFDDAKASGKAIVLYFEDKTKDTKWLDEVDLAELQKKGLVACVKVPADQPAIHKEEAASVVPKSKLGATNLWKAYSSPAAATFIICDEHGNEFFRCTERKLEANVTKLRARVKEVRKKIDGLNTKAQTAIDAKDDESAVKELLKAFKYGMVGWDEAKKSEELYAAIMVRAKEKVEVAKKDEAKLTAMKKAYAGTDVAADIDAAIKSLKTSN